MNKAMLFFFSLLFSISASAATLNIEPAGTSNATQEISLNNNDIVLADGTVRQDNTNWSSFFNVTSDTDTPVRIVWSFNPEAHLESASLALFDLDSGNILEQFDITGDFSFTAMLMAGITYGLDIFDATSDELKYDVSVSAVPVPAAFFLFAPALLGLIGLRQKAKSNA